MVAAATPHPPPRLAPGAKGPVGRGRGRAQPPASMHASAASPPRRHTTPRTHASSAGRAQHTGTSCLSNPLPAIPSHDMHRPPPRPHPLVTTPHAMLHARCAPPPPPPPPRLAPHLHHLEVPHRRLLRGVQPGCSCSRRLLAKHLQLLHRAAGGRGWLALAVALAALPLPWPLRQPACSGSGAATHSMQARTRGGKARSSSRRSGGAAALRPQQL